MEILIEPNQSINGKSHHSSRMIRNCANTPSVFLDKVVEPNYVTESELKSHP